MKTAVLHRLCVVLACAALVTAQETTVTANVSLANDGKKKGRAAGNVVLWLTPVSGAAVSESPSLQAVTHPRLIQHNKSFDPHVLIVPVGSVVEFPNHDPFFHNVFSLFDGKRFDLGLYEAGSVRNVVFDKPGISYIFCNIHAEMSAVVIAVTTPYYGMSDRHGQVTIPHVPPGHYILRFWYDEALPETLQNLTREITISADTSNLGALRLPATSLALAHQNLYGHDYPPPQPDNSPGYERH
jgi:plastocyanin